MCGLVVGMVFVAANREGVQAGEGELPGKAMFEGMVGEWTSEGKLTSPASSEVIHLTEKWNGKFTADGKGFIIEGERDWNGERQTFKWEYSYHAANDTVGATYKASNLDNEVTLEVSVNEVEGFFLLRASIGDDGAEIQIEKRFKGGKLSKDRLTVFGGNGQTTLEGNILYQRKK